jgi:hypothetical protein
MRRITIEGGGASSAAVLNDRRIACDIRITDADNTIDDHFVVGQVRAG